MDSLILFYSIVTVCVTIITCFILGYLCVKRMYVFHDFNNKYNNLIDNYNELVDENIDLEHENEKLNEEIYKLKNDE